MLTTPLLDLSAALNIIDYYILIENPHTFISQSDTVFDWFCSYFFYHTQSAYSGSLHFKRFSIWQSSSKFNNRSLQFLYLSPNPQNNFQVSCSFYDTQIYISCSSSFFVIQYLMLYTNFFDIITERFSFSWLKISHNKPNIFFWGGGFKAPTLSLNLCFT